MDSVAPSWILCLRTCINCATVSRGGKEREGEERGGKGRKGEERGEEGRGGEGRGGERREGRGEERKEIKVSSEI